VTALRQVRSERRSAVPVVEFIDVSDIGEALGLHGRMLLVPELAERVDVTAVLKQLRTVLVTTMRDHAFSLMRAVVLSDERPFASMPRLQDLLVFRDRTRAGVGGIDESGRMLAFAVPGSPIAEMVVFTLWHTPARYTDTPPSMLITPADFVLGDPEGEWELRPYGLMAVRP
jgi:hypothetical protein